MVKFIFIFKMIEINCVRLHIFYIILLDFKKRKYYLIFTLLSFVFFGTK